MNYLTQYWHRRFQAWIKRRIEPARHIVLGRRNLFIFPSRGGAGFLVLLALLWVLGTNYENTLVLMLAFLLTSVFVVTILHTYGNLAGLALTIADVRPVFVGEQAAFHVRLTRPDKVLKGVQLDIAWAGQPSTLVNVNTPTIEATLSAHCAERGWFQPGRLKLQSHFPLGIIRCWTWLDLDVRALVYPAPVISEQAPWQDAEGELDTHFQRAGTEDFVGLEPYMPGHSLRRVSWKHFARGQGLLLKEFADPQGQAQALDWDFFSGMETEGRLSRLCYWVLYLHQRGLPYSLSLPTGTIAMGQGDQQRDTCLACLALFGKDAP